MKILIIRSPLTLHEQTLADTNAIKRQTQMKMKVLIPHSPQSLHEHNLANTNLFVFLCISYYLFLLRQSPYSARAHFCKLFNFFLKIFTFIFPVYTIHCKIKPAIHNFFYNNLKTVWCPILAHLS